MFGWSSSRSRRKPRESRGRQRLPASTRRWVSWPALLGLTFVLIAAAVTLVGEAKIDYVVGQRLEQPIYAKVDFQVEDPSRTDADRTAARARTPSRYTPNSPALTFDRIRADLLRVLQAAADAESFEQYQAALLALGWPAESSQYDRLRALATMSDDAGKKQWQEWVANLPLERHAVVRNWVREPRDPASLADYILLETKSESGEAILNQIAHSELVSQGNETNLQGVATRIARSLPAHELPLRSVIEATVLRVFREQPTLLYDQPATEAAMKAAAEATPPALTTFTRNQPFINPGTLNSDEYELLKRHRDAYLAFLQTDTPEAKGLRFELRMEQAGLVALVALVALGFVAYGRTWQKPLFGGPERAIPCLILAILTLVAVRFIDIRWPQYQEFLLVPALMAACIYAIVFDSRFAQGASCFLAILVALVARAHLPLLLAVLTGVVVAVGQLDEIRTRTKLPTVGAITALAVILASAAGGLFEGHTVNLVLQQALVSGVLAFGSVAVISMLLPFIERMFQTATAQTLLEWRDPTRPLLQLLAREAPGTYSHSLVLGTMAEAACERIGANSLLTQVGALYHDVGKIHRPTYFTENQEGRINRHENLAPSMSLLIILGHVKDGLELARQYKLPRVLHQFITEHHGTTVVRYFHRMASDKQPHISSGRHDREVSEADFRYGGPKPRSRESAVLMLCDSVEGAVRSLSEPTVGRIESTVEQIVSDRLADGQFDECDITLREIRMVRESLVKSLCSIYHGRVAYPKAPAPAKPLEESSERQRVSV